MARTLAEIVGQNKKGLVKGPTGVLSEQPDLQGLTGQAGLPAAPTTAIGGAMLGATPDQQKMMGSPAQVQNALRMSQEGAETLEGARRLRQARTATTAEQEKMQKAEALEGLTSAEKTTKTLIQREMDKLTQAQAPTAEQLVITAPPTAGMTITPEAFGQVRPLVVSALANVREGKPIDQATIAAINIALGRPVTDLVDENFLNQFLVNSKEQIKQQGADAVRNNLTVKDLVEEPSFGYTTEQLSELLGVDPKTLEATTVGDLDLLIKNAQTQQFSTVTGTREAIQSGLLGQAERQAARQTIREASETGIAATEEDFQRLDDAIEKADIITFGGKQMTVGDALKDETISQFIADYIDAAPEQKKEMEAQEPSLTSFIKNNQAVFTAATEGFKAATTQFKATQESNKTYAENFPPSLLNAVFPDWQKPSAGALKDNQIPLFQYFNALSPEQQANVKQNLARAVGNRTWLANELKDLTPDQLKKLQLDKTGTSLLDSYIQGRERYEQIQSMDPDNIDAIVQELAGRDTNVSAASMQKVLDNYKQLAALGYKVPSSSVFDIDGDRKLDSPETLLNTLRKRSSSASLGEYLTDPSKLSLPSFKAEEIMPSASAQILLDNLSAELADGKLTEKEITSSKNLDLDKLSQIMTSKDWSKLPVQVRTGLTSVANRLRSEKFGADIVGVGKSLGKTYKNLVSNPEFTKQIQDPSIYGKNLTALSDAQLQDNVGIINNLKQSIDALLEQQEDLAFPTVDLEQLRNYSASLGRMVSLNQAEVDFRIRRAAGEGLPEVPAGGGPLPDYGTPENEWIF